MRSPSESANFRKQVVFYLNGQLHQVDGAEVFSPLGRYLRETKLFAGTKLVCEEGDCGSCSVLVGSYDAKSEKIKYRVINSCIAPLYTIDACHVVTIEGLNKNDGLTTSLTEVQQQMVYHGGSQCGYCTPGITVALTGLCETLVDKETNGANNLDVKTVKDALTGNLCRCTGYFPILESAEAINLKRYVNLDTIYHKKISIELLKNLQKDGLELTHKDQCFFAPSSIEGVIQFKVSNPGYTIAAGYTDLGVEHNKKNSDKKQFLSLTRVEETHEIKEKSDCYVIGASVTLSQLEVFFKERLPEFSNLLGIFASPQIKERATLIGNLGNGSPIGDTIPFLNVSNAEVEVAGPGGRSYNLPVSQLYRSYRQLAIGADEFLTAVKIPKFESGQHFYLYKVSKRRDLDISTISMAIYIEKDSLSKKVHKFRLALGGVGPIVMRFPKLESQVVNHEFDQTLADRLSSWLRSELNPLSDVRGSASFRQRLVSNLIQKFYLQLRGAS